mmetsp:Transcript_8584/g.18056  ORF Transcript_8584/g.18056 Transcript_8584/m.18056 type:complete len:299 (+) Transcript_8584:65-961(+)
MMISINIIICYHLLAVSVFSFTESFTSITQIKSFLRYSTGNQLLLAANVHNDDDTGPESGGCVSLSVNQKSSALKRELLQLAASYDRGFGATPRAREEASDIIQQLAVINPTENAARGIDGNGEDDDAPLKGAWRMIWTTALDVVSLAASPVAAPSAIYQVIDPPVAINIIDFIPRVQTFFPPSIAQNSLLRAEVGTRAYPRFGKPNRVGLVFEGIKLQPVEIFGQKVGGLPPLSVDFTWPQNFLAQFVPGIDDLGSTQNDPDALGYFDIEYLDDELLVIKQQGGGRFALVKVNNYDP